MIVSAFQARDNVLVAFSTSDVLWERIVRRFTKSSTSHALLLIKRADGWVAMEMKDQGFQLVAYATWAKSNRLVATFSTRHSTEQQLTALQALHPYRDAKYDHAGFYLYPFSKRRPVRTGKLICTEMVAIYLRALGLDADPAVAATPAEQLAWLATHPQARREYG